MTLHSLKPSENLSRGRGLKFAGSLEKPYHRKAKRIRLGHLPEGTTLEKYEEIISSVLNQPDAQLYLFVYGSSIYPTAIALVAESASAPLHERERDRERVWLVMLGLDGVLETGFPPESPESYSNFN